MAYKIDLYNNKATIDYSHIIYDGKGLTYIKTENAIKHPRFKGGQVTVTVNTKIKNNINYFTVDGVGYFIADVSHINDNVSEITGELDASRFDFDYINFELYNSKLDWDSDLYKIKKDETELQIYLQNRIKFSTEFKLKYSKMIGPVNYWGIDYFGNSVSENSSWINWKESYSNSVFKDGIYPKNKQIEGGIKAKGIVLKPFSGKVEWGQPTPYYFTDVSIPYSEYITDSIIVGLDGEMRTLPANVINFDRTFLAINKGDSVRNTKVYLIASDISFNNQVVIAEWEFKSTYYAFNYSKLDVRYKEKYGMDSMDIVKSMTDLATTLGVGALTGFGATGMGSVFSAIGDSVFAVLNRNVFYNDLGSSFYIETGKNSAGSTLRNNMTFTIINVDNKHFMPNVLQGFRKKRGYIKGLGHSDAPYNGDKLVSAIKSGCFIE